MCVPNRPIINFWCTMPGHPYLPPFPASRYLSCPSLQMRQWAALAEERRATDPLGAARILHEHGMAQRTAEVLVVSASGRAESVKSCPD